MSTNKNINLNTSDINPLNLSIITDNDENEEVIEEELIISNDIIQKSNEIKFFKKKFTINDYTDTLLQNIINKIDNNEEDISNLEETCCILIEELKKLQKLDKKNMDVLSQFETGLSKMINIIKDISTEITNNNKKRFNLDCNLKSLRDWMVENNNTTNLLYKENIDLKYENFKNKLEIKKQNFKIDFLKNNMKKLMERVEMLENNK